MWETILGVVVVLLMFVLRSHEGRLGDLSKSSISHAVDIKRLEEEQFACKQLFERRLDDGEKYFNSLNAQVLSVNLAVEALKGAAVKMETISAQLIERIRTLDERIYEHQRGINGPGET